jgi:cytochrome c oxidase subunit 2
VVVNVVDPDEFQTWVAERSPAKDGGEQQVARAEPEQARPSGGIIAEAAAATPAAPAEVEWNMDTAMAEGQSLYNGSCAACHQANGQGLAAAGFPALAGSPVATGPVHEHIRVAVHGRPGTAMAAFGPQLSDQELAAIVTYQRNAWGNNTGDLVAPEDIAAAR